MTNFYKIPKDKAALIGEFFYDKDKSFNPFCSEQVDGTYLKSVELIEQLKDNENIKKVDWSEFDIINESQVDTKQTFVRQ